MKTKLFQTLLKVWIAIASLAAFLSGWILLGHSGKPVDTSLASAASDSSTTPSQVSPLATLAPLPSLNSRSLQPLQQSPATSFSKPRMRTRGS